MYKTDYGTYYLIATVPEYDRIVIRKASSINGLKNVAEKAVWRKHEKGVMGHHIWAQNLRGNNHGTALVMSEMKNPTTLTGPEVVLTEPEFNWERTKYNVNEGAAVIKRNGKIFVTYSASATNHKYCMGLLWIDEAADLLDVSNWHKSPGPVFYTNEELNRYGPGHNSFTTAAGGETVIMIYHARDYREIQGHELSEPNRATRARIVRWTESGFPDFMQNVGD